MTVTRQKWHPLRIAMFLTLFAFASVMATRLLGDHPALMVATSYVITAFCVMNAIHLLGVKATGVFFALGVSLGWFFEQVGVKTGFLFGKYHYTDVLGTRLGEVPIVIPLMWFSVVYLGYVVSNLICAHEPVFSSRRILPNVWLSLVCGFLIAGYDLCADPYQVLKVKAWVMTEKGPYFGETFEGFFGWTVVSFIICILFRLWLNRGEPVPVGDPTPLSVATPVLSWAFFCIFFVVAGYPEATRAISVFVIGTPTLVGAWGWARWRTSQT